MLYWGKNPNGGIVIERLVSGNCMPVHLKQQLMRHNVKLSCQIPRAFDLFNFYTYKKLKTYQILSWHTITSSLSPPGVLSLSCYAYGSRACYTVQGSSRAWEPALKHVWRGDLRTNRLSLPKAASLPSLVQLRQEILIETLDLDHLEDQGGHFLQGLRHENNTPCKTQSEDNCFCFKGTFGAWQN